ncbi:hypothetical protein KOW79_018428 [Hemibagrus wyckioides]|uniref:Uncharacterized protein n=1 Tax=Hemibagrus wyckioides TaxID=337641 RepID=A0A9D3NCA5_9TELE|nr:hypothetical protein KOW79_018428 [Hemibagrus wyckioides]
MRRSVTDFTKTPSEKHNFLEGLLGVEGVSRVCWLHFSSNHSTESDTKTCCIISNQEETTRAGVEAEFLLFTPAGY